MANAFPAETMAAALGGARRSGRDLIEAIEGIAAGQKDIQAGMTKVLREITRAKGEETPIAATDTSTVPSDDGEDSGSGVPAHIAGILKKHGGSAKRAGATPSAGRHAVIVR